MLLVPEKPGCKILPFHLAENQLDGYIEEIRKDWVYPIDDSILQEKLLEKAIPDLKPDDEVRALILFSNGLDLPFSMHIIQAAYRRTNGTLAIGKLSIVVFCVTCSSQQVVLWATCAGHL